MTVGLDPAQGPDISDVVALLSAECSSDLIVKMAVSHSMCPI